MTKYGFDYFTKRVEVLTEMAGGRPSKTLLGAAGAKVTQYINTINSIMRQGGTITDYAGDEVEVPGLVGGRGTNIQLLGYKYILGVMTGIVTDDIVDPMTEPEIDMQDYNLPGADKQSYRKSRDEFRDKAMDILDIDPHTPDKLLPRPVQLLAKAIGKWISDNEELVMSKEFEQKITNPDLILGFIAPEWRRTAAHSNTGKAKAQKTEDTYGMEVINYERIVSSIAPQLRRLNQLLHHDNMRKSPSTSVEVSKPAIPNTIATDNIFITLYVLNDIESLLGVITNTIKRTMELEEFSNVIENGIARDDPDYNEKEAQFYTITTQITQLLDASIVNKKYNFNTDTVKSLTFLASNSGYDSYINDTMEYFQEFTEGMTVSEIVKELESQKSFTSETIHPLLDDIALAVSRLSEEEKDNNYPEFPQNTLNKVFNTADLKTKFHTWYTKVFLPKRIKAMEDIIQNELHPKPTANDKRAIDTASDRLKKKQSDKLSELEAEYETPSYGGDINSEYRESYVLSYMTEQINKDKFTPRGEFRDRGFKKPSNYWQGATNKL